MDAIQSVDQKFTKFGGNVGGKGEILVVSSQLLNTHLVAEDRNVSEC